MKIAHGKGEGKSIAGKESPQKEKQRKTHGNKAKLSSTGKKRCQKMGGKGKK